MTGRSLGLAQGMAAGFMIAVTLLEIIPEALGGVEVWQCVSLAGAGAASIFLLKHLLPEPDLSVFLGGQGVGGGGGGEGRRGGGGEKGFGMVEKRGGGNSRSRGSSGGNNNSSSSPRVGAGAGGNGSNSSSSSSSNNQQHFRRALSSDTAAAAAAAAVDDDDDDSSYSPNESGLTKPYTFSSSSSSPLPLTLLEKQQRNSLLWSGLKIALSLSLHNFPEGIATFAASLKGLEFGLPLAISIAFHNLPEGAACAIPIFFATGSRSKALLVALLSGLAEPVGVLFVAILGPASLTPAAVASLLAAVGGVMLGLSVFELGPQAVDMTTKREAVLFWREGWALW